MEYDSNLNKIKKSLEGITAGSFSGFITSSETAFSSLRTALSGFDFSSIWKDQVSVSYESTLKSVMDLSNSCADFATNVVEPLSKNIPALEEETTKYLKAVDEYNNIEEEYNKMNVGAMPLLDNNENSEAYQQWVRRVNAKEQKRAQLLKKIAEINELIISCYNIINVINGTLGAEIVTASVISSFDGLKIESYTDYEENGNIVKKYHWCDENDNLIREDYTIISKDGIVIENGSVDYYSNGKRKEYNKIIDEDTSLNNVVEEYNEKDILTNRTIGALYDDGMKQYDIEEKYDKNGKIEERNTKRSEIPGGVVQLGFTETYANDELIETSVDEVQYSNGKIEKKVHNDLVNKITTISEVKYSSGAVAVEKDVYIDEKNNFSRYGETVDRKGTVRKDVYIEYEEVDTSSGKEKYIKTRSIDKEELKSGEVHDSVYEEWEIEDTTDGIKNYTKSRYINSVEYEDGEVNKNVRIEYDRNGKLVEYSYDDDFSVEEVPIEDLEEKINSENS